MAVERVFAGYHIARHWPSACGSRLIFMQDMVGMGEFPWNFGKAKTPPSRGTVKDPGH
jgi:hypothetical protein